MLSSHSTDDEHAAIRMAQALLDHAESKTTFQTGEILYVPAESYADQNLHEREIQTIFRQLPLVLGLTCELPHQGDFKVIEAAGVPIILVRNRAGEVGAFLNICAHRWAPLAPDGLGNCRHFRLSCPFHGWTYSLDGDLLGVAGRSKFGDIDLSTHGLRRLPCEERAGIIFGCLTPDGRFDLESFYGPILQDFSAFALEEWEYLGTDTVEGPNWKLVLTNFLESYHITAQHPKTLGPHLISNLNQFESSGPHLRMGTATRSISHLREVPKEDWAHREGIEFHITRFLFPNVTCMLGSSETSNFVQILPSSTPGNSRVIVTGLRRKPTADEEAVAGAKANMAFQDRIEAATNILRNEDFVTGFATQPGLHTGAHAGFIYGRNEAGPQYFHKWIDWFLREDSSAPRPKL